MAPIMHPDFDLPGPSGLAQQPLPTGPGLKDGPTKRFLQRVIRVLTTEPDVDGDGPPESARPASHA
jgi:hypothetical protein